MKMNRSMDENDIREALDSYIKVMNEQRLDTLLLFTWNLFNIQNVKSVKMIKLDYNSFTLKITIKSMLPPFKKDIEKKYNFNPPLLNASEAKSRISSLNDRYSLVHFPMNGGTLISLGLWISSLCSIIQAKELLQFSVFVKLRDLSLQIYGTPEFAAYCKLSCLFSHNS